MKSPYKNRWFCAVFSVVLTYFLIEGWNTNHKINILNLMLFICTTFLALHPNKGTSDKFAPEDKEKKNLCSSILEETPLDLQSIQDNADLKLTDTFKKKI